MRFVFLSALPRANFEVARADHIHSLVDQGIAVVLIVNTPHASEQLMIDADLVERLSGCLVSAPTAALTLRLGRMPIRCWQFRKRANAYTWSTIAWWVHCNRRPM